MKRMASSNPATPSKFAIFSWSLNRIGLANDIIESCAANEPFRGQYDGKLGWYNRVCGGTRMIDYIGINNLS
jgi:hypothetical protein